MRLPLPVLVRDLHLAKEANDFVTIVALLRLHGDIAAYHARGLLNEVLLEIIRRVI